MLFGIAPILHLYYARFYAVPPSTNNTQLNIYISIKLAHLFMNLQLPLYTIIFCGAQHIATMKETNACTIPVVRQAIHQIWSYN